MKRNSLDHVGSRTPPGGHCGQGVAGPRRLGGSPPGSATDRSGGYRRGGPGLPTVCPVKRW